MYKLKNKLDVDKSARTKHLIAILIELALSVASIGLLIYYIAAGDPNKRILPTLGSVFVFLVPLVIEAIFKKRFSLGAHLSFTVYVFLAVFVGCGLNMHNNPGPYDEIAHFIFGYVSCLFFFYVMIGWKDYGRQSIAFNALAIFLLGMAIAPIWEVMEFFVDVFLAQNSLGFPTEEFLAEMAAQGVTGLELNIRELMDSVTVWDTITDMTLHTGGSILFTIQYVIHKKIKKPLMLGLMEKDYLDNRARYFDYIPKDEVTTADESAVTDNE